MTVSPRLPDLRHAGTAVALALALLTIVTGRPAIAQEDPDDPYKDSVLNTDKRILDGVLSVFGLAPASQEVITYRERSPLVVPPSGDLPPPEKDNVAKNPAWPVPPEVKLRKLDAAAARQNFAVDEGKPITGTKRDVRYKTPEDKTEEGPSGKKTKEPDFLSALLTGKLPLGNSNKDEVGSFTGEPPRQTLTDPPVGYQTPSPAAPYGVTADRDPGTPPARVMKDPHNP
jgi:hypothetical protein